MPITLPLKKMSRSEKLMAMESLWTDLSADDAKLGSPRWHASALKEAEQAVRAGKAKFMDWNEAKVQLRRKAAKIA